MLTIHNVSRQEIEQEVTTVLAHLGRLLRAKNQLRSPLLRLPTETILRILSFVMGNWNHWYRPWWSIYLTCHRIYKMMHAATELWWKVDFMVAGVAHFFLSRSKGNPQVIVSDLRSITDKKYAETEMVLDHWRDKRVFGGNRLHTLEFVGPLPRFDHFSWILERPLPHVRHLKIHVTESHSDDFIDIWASSVEPVRLGFPMEMPLQVLDLRNVVLSWPSNRIYNGLRELRLDFRDCDADTVPSEDELFDILEASQQLEHLSLLQVGHDTFIENGEILSPGRLLRFPNLVSLALDDRPLVVKHTLEYMYLPAITSLYVRSFVSPDMAQNFQNILFPDNHLPARLFPNPPRFAVTISSEESDTCIQVEIGGIKIWLDFFGEVERGRDAVMSCIPSLVPSSVISLKLEYTRLSEREWRDFFMSCPEIRSIECSEFYGMAVSRSLWDALLPTGEGIGIPCPRLESISVTSYTKEVVFTPLSDCLRHRKAAGFKLKRLKMDDFHWLIPNMDGFHEEFGPLAEVVEARKSNSYERRWGGNFRYQPSGI